MELDGDLGESSVDEHSVWQTLLCNYIPPCMRLSSHSQPLMLETEATYICSHTTVS